MLLFYLVPKPNFRQIQLVLSRLNVLDQIGRNCLLSRGLDYIFNGEIWLLFYKLFIFCMKLR